MLAVDNSTLTSVQTCETQAALRYILGMAGADDTAPLRAGSAVHAAIATWFRSRGDALLALTTLEQEYRAWAEEHVLEPDDRLSWPNVARVMTQWFDVHSLASFPLLVGAEFVEVGFALPLNSEFVFVGRLDALGHDHQNAWSIVETKTTGRLDERWRTSMRVSAQITGYVWGAQQYLSRPVTGALVNGIQLSLLPTAATRCRQHGVKYSECGHQHAKFDKFETQRPPHLQEAWHRDAVALATQFARLKERVRTIDDIPALATNGQFIGACAQCPFQLYCQQGRPTEARHVDAMLRHDPWSPYDHAFGKDEADG